MTTRTIGELKEAAREVLASVEDLSQVYLASAQLVTHDYDQAPPFHTDTNVQLKFERRGTNAVEIWARYLTEVIKPPDDTDAAGAKADEADEADERALVWTIELECVAEYELTDGARPSAAACQAFAVLVGSSALHPYARDWTQHLSSQSRYPALTLGMLRNVAELSDDHEIEFPDFEEDE